MRSLQTTLINSKVNVLRRGSLFSIFRSCSLCLTHLNQPQSSQALPRVCPWATTPEYYLRVTVRHTAALQKWAHISLPPRYPSARHTRWGLGTYILHKQAANIDHIKATQACTGMSQHVKSVRIGPPPQKKIQNTHHLLLPTGPPNEIKLLLSLYVLGCTCKTKSEHGVHHVTPCFLLTPAP